VSGYGEILDWLHRPTSPVRVAYEADPTGFGLARVITEAGMECTVAAPSKLERPVGDRVMTDARDAAHLARLLRLGEITAVRAPNREIEAVRDLVVRAREDARANLITASAVETSCAAAHRVLRRNILDGRSRGVVGSASTTSTSRRPSITALRPCWRPRRRVIASMSRSLRSPPHRGSPTRSTGWAVCVPSRP
jgi:hypothetical protein